LFIKKTITAVAVDSARDYLKERLAELKQLDLDKDGQKDVDQVMEVLNHLGEKVKDSIDSTDFPKLASGLEQIFNGIGLVGDSVDRQKLAATCDELAKGIGQIGHLLRLGIAEVKNQEQS
jgi:hypothetical protein